MPVTDSPFWQFALTLYRNDELRSALLALQDEHQVVIIELLFATWLAEQGINWREKDRLQSRQRTAPWVDEVIVPLRKLRRRWCANAGRDAGYRHLLAMELEAEQYLANLLLQQKMRASKAHSASSMLLGANLAWLGAQHGVAAARSDQLVALLAAVIFKMP